MCVDPGLKSGQEASLLLHFLHSPCHLSPGFQIYDQTLLPLCLLVLMCSFSVFLDTIYPTLNLDLLPPIAQDRRQWLSSRPSIGQSPLVVDGVTTTTAFAIPARFATMPTALGTTEYLRRIVPIAKVAFRSVDGNGLTFGTYSAGAFRNRCQLQVSPD